MLINVYFQAVQDLIKSSKIKVSFILDCEERGMYEGFIRGQITLKDNSILHLREFVYVEITVDRKMYSYQYVDANNNLIFRYDNTEHHRKLNLPSFPHHKHDGDETNIVASNAPFLFEVLKEIEIIQIASELQ